MAGRSTFIQIPQDVTSPEQLRRFLDKLVQQLDIAFGNRGDEKFVSESNFLSGVSSIQELITALQVESLDYIKVDGSRELTGILKYDEIDEFSSNSYELPSIKYIEQNFTNNPKQASITDLDQTISDPPTQEEVQAISDKVDEILSSLRNSNLI